MRIKQMCRLFLMGILLTTGLAGMGNAATLSYDFTIQYLEGTNPYGLDMGDTVTVEVNFNPLKGHQEGELSSHSLSNLEGSENEKTYDDEFALSLFLDSSVALFDQEDDVDFPDFPIVTFNTLGSDDPEDWTFNLIDFLVEDEDSWIYISVPRQYGPIVFNAGSLAGSDNVWSASSVPEPATMTLFGIGLLGLAGITRRSK